ncbi:MAG: hypothetical protein ACQEP2_06025 [Actinomycetota bacterium]
MVEKKPFLLAMDTPSIDNVKNEQGLWPLIFNNGIYLVAPLVNLEKIKKFKVELYVLPLKILNTTGLPCRVVINRNKLANNLSTYINLTKPLDKIESHYSNYMLLS